MNGLIYYDLFVLSKDKSLANWFRVQRFFRSNIIKGHLVLQHLVKTELKLA